MAFESLYYSRGRDDPDPVLFFAQEQYDPGGDSSISFRPRPVRQSELAAWLGMVGGPAAPPKAEVPGGTQISAPAQQADARMQADYARYAQQLAAFQGGQGQQPAAGPSIWDFINQGVANAPARPSGNPYGQPPTTPFGQMASFNPYGTNAPGAGALFGPTGSSQVGQP